MKLNDAISAYLDFQTTRGDSECHRREVSRMLGILDRRHPDAEISGVTAEALRGFIQAVRTRPGLKGRSQVSAATVIAHHRAVAAFFRWAEKVGVCPNNPMAAVPRPRPVETTIRPFTGEQVESLLAQPDTTTFTGLRDYALMTFLLDTGARVSEALGLTYERLRLGERVATVTGKGKKERDLPFGTCTLAWLERYLDRRRQNDRCALVFVNQDGGRLNRHSVTHRIAEFGRRAGIRGVRVSPHTFRHTFAISWLLGNQTGDFKGDVLSLQRLLGHTTPTVTARYVAFVTEDLQRLHARLSPANRLVKPPASENNRRLR